jgi:hypothetical protein
MKNARWLAGMIAVMGGVAPLSAQTSKRDVLTREEILAPAQKDRDLLLIVRSLRPHFLSAPRGVRSMANGPPAPVQLYVNDTQRPSLDDLRNIRPEEVEEIRYLDPNRAQDQYGISHSGGALLVKLRGKGGGGW